MRTDSEVELEIKKIISKSFTASDATEKILKLVQGEREALFSEIRLALDTRDIGYVRIMNYVNRIEARVKGLRT
jgi:ribosomal protein L17